MEEDERRAINISDPLCACANTSALIHQIRKAPLVTLQWRNQFVPSMSASR